MEYRFVSDTQWAEAMDTSKHPDFIKRCFLTSLKKHGF